MFPTARKSVSTLFLTLLISIACASSARADGFISPFIGYNFGGDSGCPSISNCEDKNLNWGIGVGAVGGLFGVEAEFGFVPNFFGETTTSDNSVFTFMGNFLLAPKFGPVQPYGTIGLGLIRSHTNLTLSGLLEDQDQNDFGWDVGGGLMIHFSDHFGVRGDVRYFHAFSALELLGVASDTKLDYGRFSGALLVKF